jgi:hypothetical protein
VEQQRPYKRSILNVLLGNVPGARQYVLLIFGVMSLFLAAAAASGFVFVKVIQVGHYAEQVLMEKLYVIVALWAVIWLVAFFFAVREALFISYRVAGPIKRMDRLLDEILAGRDVRITLRENDVLAGVARRINRLLELRKMRGMAPGRPGSTGL